MGRPDAQSSKDSGAEMLRILEEMLERDEDITARAVAKRHKYIGHASSITRNPHRSELLATYRTRQAERRAWFSRLRKQSRSITESDIAAKDEKIATLERRLEILQASHVAMIRAVGALGGMRMWIKFFSSFRTVREELKNMGVLPQSEITEITTSAKPRIPVPGRRNRR